MSNQTNLSKSDSVTSSNESTRAKLAYKLGLYGLMLTTGLAVILVIATFFGFSEASIVSEVISPFLTLLGTLVGTFFGVQVGSAGKEEAAKDARDANKRAAVFAAKMDPTSMDDAALNAL